MDSAIYTKASSAVAAKAIWSCTVCAPLLPLATFTATSYSILQFLEPRHVTRVVALMLIGGTVAFGAVLALGRALLCPQAPTLRLGRMRDETATYSYIWLARIAAQGLGTAG